MFRQKAGAAKVILACLAIAVLATALSGCGILRRVLLPSIQVETIYVGAETDLLPIIGANGRYGYIDNKGNVIVKPRFHEARSFYEGLAAVRRGSKWGFIDRTGKLVIPYRYGGTSMFIEGYAIVGMETGWGDKKKAVFGVIDKQGNYKIQPQYKWLEFIDGKFHAYEEESMHERKRLYDLQFRTVIQQIEPVRNQTHWEEGALSEGRQRICDEHIDYGFQDENGEVVIPIQYDHALDFSEGLAAVQEKSRNGRWGYIDRDGGTEIPMQYANAGSFHEGLAWVRGAGEGKGQISFINKANEVQFSVKGDEAGFFYDGVCPVDIVTFEPPVFIGSLIRTDAWGLIDNQGKLVLDYQYSSITHLGNGLLRVVKDTEDGIRYGYCDTKGNFIWESK